MREKDVERKLVKAVRDIGGMCIKFSTPSLNGVPDRLVLLPLGKVAFVELKAKGKKPRPLQIKRMKQLSELGCKCFLLDNVEEIGGVIDAIQSS